MPTLKEMRRKARLSVSALARDARIDRQTVMRAEEGKPVQDVKAFAILDALSAKLGREVKQSEISDLKILGED